MTEIRLFGPIELWRDGTALTLDARPQQWTVLAALSVDAGRPPHVVLGSSSSSVTANE